MAELAVLLTFAAVCLGGGMGILECAIRWTGWPRWFLSLISFICLCSGLLYLWWFLRETWRMIG